MATKKDTAKPKAKKVSSMKPNIAPRKPIRRKAVESEPTAVQEPSQIQTQPIDEKSLQTINQLTGFLGVGVFSIAITLIVQLWATLKAKFVLTPLSFLYIVFSLVLIAILVWCIRLVNQKQTLSIWVFVSFIATFILYSLAFRWFDGKELVKPMDIVTWIVLAFILFELYRLRRKNILS
jgi:hypothetical protein